MFRKIKPKSLDDYFSELTSRNGEYVYFCRIASYNEKVSGFIAKYYDSARKNGVIIDGRIPNADQNNLNYYYEQMGQSFRLDKQFILTSLKKWLPRMTPTQLNAVSGSIYDVLDGLAKQGKNENMLKNAYIKFMCWLYYKFERVTCCLGNRNIPKILYCGDISLYELLLISVLSKSGCDVALIEPNGDSGYIKTDPKSEYSDLFPIQGGTAFPQGFSLKNIQKEMSSKMNIERTVGARPSITVTHNTWAKGEDFKDVLTENRGSTTNNINTIFYKINGVDDRVNFVADLISFRESISSQQRKLIVADGGIVQPDFDETKAIKRKNQYTSAEEAATDLAKNITFSFDNNVQQALRYEFTSLMIETSKDSTMNLNRLVTLFVNILCWLKRWLEKLFSGWKPEKIPPCFILFGFCKSRSEALFMRLISKIPTDIVIFNPSKQDCTLSDPELKVFNYENTLDMPNFPKENASVRAGTVAYHAERDLDTLMYQDTGMYRNHQYSRASSIVLTTTFEEIEILWDTDLKYRPNFSTDNNEVKIPVIFTKISGVKNKDVKSYWQYIKLLMTDDTVTINGRMRATAVNAFNPIKEYATKFWKNNKLQRNEIKNHHTYQYGILRSEIQDHILDKLETLINSKIIKDTFENGNEYAIVSTILNLDTKIIRKIQNFDFTKKNPKIIYINTSEVSITFDDAVTLEFLSLIGFDVAFFIPTGYNNIENYYEYPILTEHQMGEYLYDLKLPDFSRIKPKSANPKPSWKDKLFKRGV